jgi:hypothetical protein
MSCVIIDEIVSPEMPVKIVDYRWFWCYETDKSVYLSTSSSCDLISRTSCNIESARQAYDESCHDIGKDPL